ncbi:M48 family metallopeptidase [Halodesulfovibrio marinisediminis]|uniref:STE24 endopeptidase n=1 Tax=Halodesulfovibrio marinisediminis DSM 17456 TaxID=1121457 RepID=A0A1N6EXU0_9BACT|nr:M48 family metallopeptidase [Halodesulfovibrio marinisediminis]SIN87753.1 STE24 endopeptidase [Halodesulfovibrio marinisediminis DSM 17456]
MTFLTALILFFIIGAWGLETWVSKLNLQSLKQPIPASFKHAVDAEKYAKSQAYTRHNDKLAFISGFVNVIAVVLCLLLGIFNIFNEWAAAIFNGQIMQGLAFFGIVSLASMLISLPFSIYKTFVIEEKYGFNRTTPKLFITDRLKGILLGVILGAPLAAGILWFFQTFATFGWLIAWGFATAFLFAVQYVAPIWIMPLFNKFTPLEDGELRKAIEGFAHKNGFNISGIFIIDGSKRSNKANAFFTGFGKQKRIALFDTLVNTMSTEEIVGVLAHEIGHCKLNHIKRMFLTSIITTGITFFCLSLVLKYEPLYAAFHIEHVTIAVGMVLFNFLYTPLSLIMTIIASHQSRKYEFEADAFAARTTGNPSALSKALIKLSVNSLSNLTPHPAYVALHYSHPPVVSRIKALNKIKATQ